MSIKTEPEAPTRKKRTISKLWIMILSPVVLVILLSAGAMWHHYHLDTQIAAELKKVRDAGHPVTPAELAQEYALPEGAIDRTAEWLDIIQQMKALSENSNYSGLPIIGTSEASVPLAGQPWPDEALVTQLMTDADPAMKQLLELSKSPGDVRFHREFNHGFGMLLPNVQELRNVARMLSLRARWQVYQGDSAGAAESLLAMRATIDTIKHDRIVISQLVRVAIAGVLVNDILELMPHADWNEEQLRQLQNAIESGDTFHKDMRFALHGERALGNMAFADPTSLGPDVPAAFAFTRRADHLYYLQTFDRMISASEESFAEGLAEFEKIEAEMEGQSGIQRLRHAMTLMILPSVSRMHVASGRGDANQQIVATLIASRRYKLSNGEWPTKITDLTPKFFEATPIDPFDGKSLRFSNTAKEIVVWSVGEDLVDDGGKSTPESGNREPDIGFRLEKFD